MLFEYSNALFVYVIYVCMYTYVYIYMYIYIYIYILETRARATSAHFVSSRASSAQFSDGTVAEER